MFKQLALILAIVVVAILAIVAAMSIINGDPENVSEDEEIDGIQPEATESRASIMISIGPDGGQVEISCLPPTDDQRPFLVSFENQSDVSDDLQAQVLVSLGDDVQSTVVADAPDLRPGERRNVMPEPWLDPGGITDCRIVAVQASDQVILVESD